MFTPPPPIFSLGGGGGGAATAPPPPPGSTPLWKDNRMVLIRMVVMPYRDGRLSTVSQQMYAMNVQHN